MKIFKVFIIVSISYVLIACNDDKGNSSENKGGVITPIERPNCINIREEMKIDEKLSSDYVSNNLESKVKSERIVLSAAILANVLYKTYPHLFSVPTKAEDLSRFNKVYKRFFNQDGTRNEIAAFGRRQMCGQ
jgi:hypothetical protein